MYKFLEKRKYKRIKRPYVTSFRIKQDEIEDMISTDWDMIAVNNLGAGGVFFHASRNMEVGTTLDLKISFSTFTPPIKCRGRVTRIKRYLNTFMFGIATEFTEIDENIKEMINTTSLLVNSHI